MQVIRRKSSFVAMYLETTCGCDLAEMRFELAGRRVHEEDLKPIRKPLLRP